MKSTNGEVKTSKGSYVVDGSMVLKRYHNPGNKLYGYQWQDDRGVKTSYIDYCAIVINPMRFFQQMIFLEKDIDIEGKGRNAFVFIETS